ncbi:MAG: flagellar protein FlgN [Syntrophomonas sp.]|uniref:flagellar protein FlgN n=1 Tax=Syntrophomonas sp. TaxID=2053627 RepID=UPI002613BACA|nr:flagellar protein FlgN [Syntrophomonas sp.]MDD2510713.1 flagellar protein FlgN [Syntrophomonas sp.]MDD4626544.1 flagellar protein FlgN [Syntrophomonas sp.]
MEKLLQDFIETIANQNKVLEHMAELGQQKQELIIAGKVRELDSLIQKEGITVSNLDKMEGARFKLQEELTRQLGIKLEEFSARKLLTWVREARPEIYPALEEVVNQLDYGLIRLKAINSHNNELIDQSLVFIGEIRSLFNGDVAGIYSDKGLQSDESDFRPRLNLLDKKI